MEVISDPGGGEPIVSVPTEAVLLLAVSLPPGSAAQRRAALPFAIEESLSEPLDAVHVVLGAPLAPQTWLAAVVARARMDEWLAELVDRGIPGARLVPDALLLPAPPAGMWHVMAAGERVVVRVDGGAGFATPAAGFIDVWRAAGSPACTRFGSPLPFDVPFAATVPELPRLEAVPLDLRAGAYAVAVPARARAFRRAASVAAIGIVAHTLVLAVETRALTARAAAHRERAEALLRQALPGTPLPDSDALLPAAGGRDPLLPLLARSAGALQALGGLGWSRVAWNDAERRLVLGVKAENIGTLQRAQTALTAAGLVITSGTVTAAESGADGEITVRERL